MNAAIERLQFSELQVSLREQAEDVFPLLRDEQYLNALAEKWCQYAEFCTCRDDTGKLVGMIVFYANQLNSGIAYIPHVYVSSDYRGQKLFSKMYRKVEDFILLKGFKKITLEVNLDNRIAQIAYIKQGFSKSSLANEQSMYMSKQLI